MNVLGHDHITKNNELIPESHLLKNREKQVTPPRTAEQRLTAVTTARDEVQVCRSPFP
jgi:hypothetical protein